MRNGGHVIVQREVSAVVVVVFGVDPERASQVRRVQDEPMTETLSPDRTDQPLLVCRVFRKWLRLACSRSCLSGDRGVLMGGLHGQ